MSIDEARWTAVTTRDNTQDGTFYYSVRTTGIYCRPSCGARTPRRGNIAFHDTCAAAEAAGFRPCKRCRPDKPPRAEREAGIVIAACRAIEAAETPPGLAELARAAGISPHHFHRVFKAVTGVTPKAYADALRAARVREALTKGGTVTEAIYDSGFNSSGRFYEQANKMLGMAPTRFRAGGAKSTIRFAIGQCSLGSILVAVTVKGVCAILRGDDPNALVRDLQDRFNRAELIGADPEFNAIVAKVVSLVEQSSLGLALPLDVLGTAFQQRVWQTLRLISPGKTVTYADIAAKLGQPKAVRAVAQACAANNLAVAIPAIGWCAPTERFLDTVASSASGPCYTARSRGERGPKCPDSGSLRVSRRSPAGTARFHRRPAPDGRGGRIPG